MIKLEQIFSDSTGLGPLFKKHHWLIPVVGLTVLIRILTRLGPPSTLPDDSKQLVSDRLTTRLVSLNTSANSNPYQIFFHTDRPDSDFALNNLFPVDSGPDIFWARTWDSVFKQQGSDTIYVIKVEDEHYEPLKVMQMRSRTIDTSNSK